MYFSTIHRSSGSHINFSSWCSTLKTEFCTSSKFLATITAKRHCPYLSLYNILIAMTILVFFHDWTIKSAGVAPVIDVIQYVTFETSHMKTKIQISFGYFHTAKMDRQCCSLIKSWTNSSIGCITIVIVFIANRLPRHKIPSYTTYKIHMELHTRFQISSNGIANIADVAIQILTYTQKHRKRHIFVSSHFGHSACGNVQIFF